MREDCWSEEIEKNGTFDAAFIPFPVEKELLPTQSTDDPKKVSQGEIWLLQSLTIGHPRQGRE